MLRPQFFSENGDLRNKKYFPGMCTMSQIDEANSSFILFFSTCLFTRIYYKGNLFLLITCHLIRFS